MTAFKRILLIITFAVNLGAIPAGATQQALKLGNFSFPNSGSPAAQEPFLRGLGALHSFWFEEALEGFREASRIDPLFAMAYWGEAMAYNHPLWAEQDTEAGIKTVAKITEQMKANPRERAYIDAVRALYGGSSDKLERDQAYERAMQKVYQQYPDDLEAASFYSLALLGTVRPGDKGFARQMKAGAIALEVYKKNPNHPGAAHYVIHAFDDPEHAILALPAAREYARIAPAAAHAQHMPCHIFLQLGMWPDAAVSNETAWRVSDEWVSRKKLNLSLRDYHSYHWLTYVYCQQGRYRKAEGLIKALRETMATHGADSVRWYDDAAGLYIVESERWQAAVELMSRPETSAAADAGAHAGHSGAAPLPQTYSRSARRGIAVPPFIRAYASAARGDSDAVKLLTELRALRAGAGNSDQSPVRTLEIRELEITAIQAAAKKDFDAAATAMKRATLLEEEMSPPSGPPTLIKPSHELFGEILLKAGKPQDAIAQFAKSLERQPNRARSLIGIARAYSAGGQADSAREAWAKLLEMWKLADADLPELAEAKAFLNSFRSASK